MDDVESDILAIEARHPGLYGIVRKAVWCAIASDYIIPFKFRAPLNKPKVFGDSTLKED